jgi:hypothetical protein
LHRGLAYLAAAEPKATPVYSAMACAASAVALVLCFVVEFGFVVLAAPLSINAAVLVAGTVMKSRAKKKARRSRARRAARKARKG